MPVTNHSSKPMRNSRVFPINDTTLSHIKVRAWIAMSSMSSFGMCVESGTGTKRRQRWSRAKPKRAEIALSRQTHTKWSRIAVNRLLMFPYPKASQHFHRIFVDNAEKRRIAPITGSMAIFIRHCGNISTLVRKRKNQAN